MMAPHHTVVSPMLGATKFTSLDLHPALLRNLTEIGYTDMTLVQAETLPAVTLPQNMYMH